MSILLNEKQIEQIRANLSRDETVTRLWVSLCQRVVNRTRCAGLIQPGDDPETWWYLAWGAMSNAAFVYRIQPDVPLGQWLIDVTLSICSLDANDWIGPWFRKRSDPPRGMLETAHLGYAVGTVLDLCSDLFTEAQRGHISDCLRTKCQVPCHQFCEETLNSLGDVCVNNFFTVISSGYAFVSVLLKDSEAIKKSVEYYQFSNGLYNQDSYGETMEYYSYAALLHSTMYAALTGCNESLKTFLDIGSFARCIPWMVQGFMHMKPIDRWGSEAVPRYCNFSDSEAILYPPGDLLLLVAVHGKKDYPREAGLARWLFDQIYRNPFFSEDIQAHMDIGFLKTFGFLCLALYADASAPLSPESAGLRLAEHFETGHVMIRDQWREPHLMLFIQGGYGRLNVTSHRHNDQNSFILVYDKERFFADPGRACYRLQTHKQAQATSSHNTWQFIKQDSSQLNQVPAHGDRYYDEKYGLKPLNRSLYFTQKGSLAIYGADCAAAYGQPLVRAERIFVVNRPHCLFIIDRIQSIEPIKVRTNFILNNHDNALRVQEATHQQLTCSRQQAALKSCLLSVFADNLAVQSEKTRSWGCLHDCGHVLPNHTGQGKEGSAVIYTDETAVYATSFTIVYAVAMDCVSSLGQWDIRKSNDCTYQISTADTGLCTKMRLTDNLLTVTDDLGDTIEIALDS